jgi:lipopolysaccharide biosynthesis glycosyltransferase
MVRGPLDFSKCQCPQAGWCSLHKKEMTANPPNWQWCQNITQEQRKNYWEKNRKAKKKIKRETGKAPVYQFYDNLPTKRSNIAICTIGADKNAILQLQHTYDSHQAYADRCGADYVVLYGDQAKEWPMANKYRVEQVAQEYDKTLYLDCDVFITDKAPNIFEITPDDKISAYDEYKDFRGKEKWIDVQQTAIKKILDIPNCNPVGTRMLNGGVLVIPKSCSHLYSQPQKPYPKFWCFDQNYLTLTCDKIHILPKTFNTSWVSRKCDGDNNLYNHLDDAHFIHINDAKPEKKIEQLSVLKHCKNGEDFKTFFMQTNIDHNDCPRCQVHTVDTAKNIITLRGNEDRKISANDLSEKISVAVLGHKKSQLDRIKLRPYIKKVNLNDVGKGVMTDNRWAESRAIFFKDDVFWNDKEFVGLATASWNQKYDGFKIDDLENWPNLHILLDSSPEDKIVLCADVHCCCEWYREVSNTLFGDNWGVRMISKALGMKPACKNVPYSQQLFMHKENFNILAEFMNRFEVISLAAEAAEATRGAMRWQHAYRAEAYYMEFISTLFLSNQDWTYVPNVSRKLDWYEGEIERENEK